MRWVWPAALGAVSAVAFVGLAVTVGHGPLQIDDAIRGLVHPGGPLPPVLEGLDIVGGGIVWNAGVVALALGLLLAGRRREALFLAAGVLIGEVVATATKLIVDRPRPPGVAVQDLVTQASFPSGHATRAAITAALLVILLARGSGTRAIGAIAAIVLAGLMGAARVVSGEHWPTDVLGAWLLSAAVIAAVLVVPARLRQTDRVRPPRQPPASGPERSP